MDAEFHALLLRHDTSDPHHWEAPPGHDRDALLARVRAVARHWSAHPDWAVHSDDSWQDATCAASLHVVTADGRDAMVRFSTFGSLAVVFCWAKSGAHPPDHARRASPLENDLTPPLQATGFTVLPLDVLDQPYDGVRGPFASLFEQGQMSWFERYFEFC